VSISIGCAIWSYPGWVGEVYPPKTPAKDFFRLCRIVVKSPINAGYLHEMLVGMGVSIDPLPPKFVDDSPVQLNLF
jgi:hypothetical protein